MRLSFRVEGDLRLTMDEEIQVGRMAALQVVSRVGTAIKQDWRGQIGAAGLGRRLGNTVRAETYPRSGQGSLNAATLVYSKASHIVGAFEQGVEIRSKNGFWLAIPTRSAGKSARGGRISPGEWERRTGRRLRFVYRRGRTALLVDDGTRNAATSRLRKGHFGPRQARGFANRTVPIFVLVPRVRLGKRLGLYTAADRLAAGMAGNLVRAWRT